MPTEIFVENTANRYTQKIRSGSHTLYRKNPSNGKDTIIYFKKISTITIRKSSLHSDTISIKPGDFILKKYTEEAAFLKKIYYNRKKAITFAKSDPSTTFYSLLVAGPISGLMPIAAPLGYIGNNDWSGLVLWSVNMTPYLYLEIDGISKYFKGRTNRR
jgi:hypothetical protein